MLEEILNETNAISEKLTIGSGYGKKSYFYTFVFDKGVDQHHQAIGGDREDPPPTMEDGQQYQDDVSYHKDGW